MSSQKMSSLANSIEMTPTRIMVLSFLLLIIICTALLMLPWCYVDNTTPPLIDVLFMSTSAVCITGLCTVDVASEFSRLGQCIILLFMQIGGLGMVTFTASLLLLFGGRLGLKQRHLLQDYLPGIDIGNVLQVTRYVLVAFIGIELLGAAVLASVWIPEFGWSDGVFHSIFHSVAALCNAGISTLPHGLVTYGHNFTIMLTIISMIVMGGLGYVVIYDFVKRLKEGRSGLNRPLSLHVKVVLVTSLILNLMGMLGILLLEHHNAELCGNCTVSETLLTALFQSITCRSCGFNTMHITSLEPYTKQFMMSLMFIGGATGSTASGIKVTTFALLMMATWAHLSSKRDIEISGRRIPWQRIAHATSLTIIALFTVIAAIVILCYLEPDLDYADVVFDAVSALGTVGLSTGIPAKCGVEAKLVFCICMFIGRLGPFTMALSLMATPHRQHTTMPEGNILIG